MAHNGEKVTEASLKKLFVTLIKTLQKKIEDPEGAEARDMELAYKILQDNDITLDPEPMDSVDDSYLDEIPDIDMVLTAAQLEGIKRQ